MAYRYISKYFKFIDAGSISGCLTDIRGVPYATPSDCSFIQGELYQLRNPEDYSFVFGQLDDYEGMDMEAGEEPMYRRAIVKVHHYKGGDSDAWVYWYNGDVQGYPVIASGDTSDYYGEENC